jgi:type IV fimbrial biogenesis protein FimT
MDERIEAGRGVVGTGSLSAEGVAGGRGPSRSGQWGVTAVELAVALAIAALLATLAVPGFASLRRSADVSSAANELVWALHLARSSARLRGQAVTVCLSRDDKNCIATPDAVAAGWLVFHPTGQAVGTQLIAAGPPLHSFHLPPEITVTASRPAVTFWPVSRAGSTSTFELCDVENRTPGRAIVVSQTGRPRVAAEAAECAG